MLRPVPVRLRALVPLALVRPQVLEALGARPAELSLDSPTADALRPVYEVLVSGLTGVSR